MLMLNRFNGLGSKRGFKSEFVLADLFASGEDGAAWDFTDFGNLFQDTGATTPVTGAGQDIKFCTDVSGNEEHIAADSGAFTSGISGGKNHAALTNDGAYLRKTVPSGTGPWHMVYVVQRDDSVNHVLVWGDVATEYVGVMQDGNGGSPTLGAGSPNYDVDGTSASTRNNLYDLTSSSFFTRTHISNITLSAWTEITIGGYGSSFDFQGELRGLVLRNSEFTAGELLAIEAYFGV